MVERARKGGEGRRDVSGDQADRAGGECCVWQRVKSGLSGLRQRNFQRCGGVKKGDGGTKSSNLQALVDVFVEERLLVEVFESQGRVQELFYCNKHV